MAIPYNPIPQMGGNTGAGFPGPSGVQTPSFAAYGAPDPYPGRNGIAQAMLAGQQQGLAQPLLAEQRQGGVAVGQQGYPGLPVDATADMPGIGPPTPAAGPSPMMGQIGAQPGMLPGIQAPGTLPAGMAPNVGSPLQRPAPPGGGIYG
jgi:hypothetical protein